LIEHFTEKAKVNAYARIGYATDSSNNVGVMTCSKGDIIKHPSWSPNFRDSGGDIALVFLSSTVNAFNAAYLTLDHAVNENEQDWLILGAGATSEEGRKPFATALQGDKISTKDFIKCKAVYHNLTSTVDVDETHHFCAGLTGEGAGACSQGDLGAPLLVVVRGFVIVSGLASFGFRGCGIDDPPFAYTRVSYYSRWIFDTICKNSIDPASTCPKTLVPTSAPVLPAKTTNLDVSFFSIISDTDKGQGSTRCGAVLVHEDIIVSAAGCIRHNDIIRVGYTSDFNAHAYRSPMNISDFPLAFLDDRYNYQENLPNDLSVVKLNASVTDITPVKVFGSKDGPRDNSVELFFAHASAVKDVEVPFKMGTFAEAKLKGVAYHRKIQTGTFYTKNFLQCTDDYIALPGYQAKLEEGLQFCTENDSRNTPCDANSWGSPTWYYDDNDPSMSTPILVGLASQGQCINGGVPYVHTRVGNYYDFIMGEICRLSSNPPSDCD